jgi:hypothetical protein
MIYMGDEISRKQDPAPHSCNEISGLSCPIHGLITIPVEMKQDARGLIEVCPYCDAELQLSFRKSSVTQTQVKTALQRILG